MPTQSSTSVRVRWHQRPSSANGRNHESKTGGRAHGNVGSVSRRSHQRSRKPRRVKVTAKVQAKDIPTTQKGVLMKLISQLTAFVDGKRRELDDCAMSAKSKRRNLNKLTHKMHALLEQTNALGLELHADVVASKELLQILLDKEPTLGMHFPQRWHAAGSGEEVVDRKQVSPTASSLTVNKEISRKAVFARDSDLDSFAAKLKLKQSECSDLAHTVKQYQFMRDRLYSETLKAKATTKHLEEYIKKLQGKERQLVRAIESEQQKLALARHRLADANKTRAKRLKEKRVKVKHARTAIAASNNMRMLIVSQAQLKKNIELKMAGDMDEADERRLNKKYAKTLVLGKLQKYKQPDNDAQLEKKFQKALHELGIEGTMDNTSCDEVIAIVQRQHEVAAELEQKKQSLTKHIASLRQQIVEAEQKIQVRCLSGSGQRLSHVSVETAMPNLCLHFVLGGRMQCTALLTMLR